VFRFCFVVLVVLVLVLVLVLVQSKAIYGFWVRTGRIFSLVFLKAYYASVVPMQFCNSIVAEISINQVKIFTVCTM
jgi:hypothetical protein